MNRANLDRIEQLVVRHNALRLAREQLLSDHDRHRSLRNSAGLESSYLKIGPPTLAANIDPARSDENRSTGSELESCTLQLELLRAEKRVLDFHNSNRVNLIAEPEERSPQLAGEEHGATTVQASVDLVKNATLVKVSADELYTARSEIHRLNEQLARRTQQLISAVREGALLKSELTAVREHCHQLREEHRSAESLCISLEAKNQEWLSAQEQLMAESRQRFDARHRHSKKALERLREMRTKLEQSVQMAEELISDFVTAARETTPTSPELETVQARPADVQHGLPGAEFLYSDMAELVLRSEAYRRANPNAGGHKTDAFATGR